MFTIKLGKKEYKVKFGYKAATKAKIVSKFFEIENADVNSALDLAGRMEKIADAVPELLLVGLQKFHKTEFSYDYDTEDGKQEKIDKIYDLLDKQSDAEDEEERIDIFELYQKLEAEMTEDGYLKKLFEAMFNATEDEETSEK